MKLSSYLITMWPETLLLTHITGWAGYLRPATRSCQDVLRTPGTLGKHLQHSLQGFDSRDAAVIVECK